MANNDSKRKTLYIEQDGKCLYCNDPLKSWESAYACMDHIFPRSLGGSDRNENLALVCYRCNSLKSDFTSIWQVVVHFARMFKLFWHLLDVQKVQDALRDGRIERRKQLRVHKNCDTCSCKSHDREKIPNPIFKVGEAPIQAVQRSVRIEAFERRRAAFQQLKGTPNGGAVRSEAQPISAQNS